ncbi:MAG: DUF4007 family protein [Acidimicrobiia bacterium]|nr:DUF4007 family protein [Acidimicrobiia bacterium]MYC57235.1 DUF4007 family protein [Acidimicrobiia bacterium]MYI30685.1 DUF4007 family protein [Acidimicrobiia bacterium]
MRLEDAAHPTFARHETFHPRYGWFRKAYEAACDNSKVFSDPDATVELGVGKNMVRSIKFWGLAAKLIEDDPCSKNRHQSDVVPTRFGHLLFNLESGWDPYMEDTGTLWLLHWKLLSPRSLLPVWWVAFNEFHAVEFDVEELQLACSGGIDTASSWQSPRPSSLTKDVTALMRTYAPAERTSRSSIDDILDCPLRELGLITRSQATEKHRFTIGTKATLPSAIATYSVLDYIALSDPGANTVLLSRMADEPGAPGRAFRLNESELAETLRPAVELLADGDLALSSHAGAAQLAWKGDDPSSLAEIILDRYFRADFDLAKAQMATLPIGAGVS